MHIPKSAITGYRPSNDDRNIIKAHSSGKLNLEKISVDLSSIVAKKEVIVLFH